jgi:hypothetical protein
MLQLSKTNYAVTARKQPGYICFPISSVSVKFLRRYDPLFKGPCCLTYTTFVKSLQYSKAGSSLQRLDQGLDGRRPGIGFVARSGDFIFATVSGQAWRSTQSPVKWVLGPTSVAVDWMRKAVNHED